MRNRISKVNLIVAALFAGFILLPSVSAQTQGGAVIFEKRCYSCHNIGSGDKKGPDLKGVTTLQSREWLREFIKSPAAMNRKGDQTAGGLVADGGEYHLNWALARPLLDGDTGNRQCSSIQLD